MIIILTCGCGGSLQEQDLAFMVPSRAPACDRTSAWGGPERTWIPPRDFRKPGFENLRRHSTAELLNGRSMESRTEHFSR